MPASITASPNPVVLTIWSVSQKGPTTIAWDTGDPRVDGTVNVSIGAGPFSQVKDSAGNPVAAATTGSTKQSIEIGKKYVFQLKSTGAGVPILASVAVEGKEMVGLPGGLIDDISKHMPLFQGITNVRVFPAIDSVRILFKTRQPTVPVIDIKRTDTNELAGAAFPFLQGAATNHDYVFPLAQNTGFTYRIFAAPAIGAISGIKAAEATGQFRTGSRKATVFFDHVFVHTDGDPGALGDGDFLFDMGACDIDSGDVLGKIIRFKGDISGGEDRSIDRSVEIEPAPTGLWVQVRAEEVDNVGSYFSGPPVVQFAPEGATWQQVFLDGDEIEVSRVTRWFDLTDAGPDAREFPFILETGPRHVDFSLNCRLRMEAMPGAVLQPMIKKPEKPIQRAKTVATMVDAARVELAGRRTHVVTLAPDGGLYHAYEMDRAAMAGKPRSMQWTRLGNDLHGPLTMVAADDALHLLAVGNAGDVVHRVVTPDAVQATPGQEKWISLGGSVVSPVVAATARDGIELFALSAEGAVLHRTLTGNAGREWQRIGEGMTGSLNAFTTPRGDIGLAALGHGGNVMYLPWSAEAARAGSAKWQSLGKAPAGALSAEFIDDVVVLAVLAGDESIQAAPWRKYPEPPAKLEWHALGTVNELISSRYSLLQRK